MRLLQEYENDYRADLLDGFIGRKELRMKTYWIEISNSPKEDELVGIEVDSIEEVNFLIMLFSEKYYITVKMIDK